MKKNLPGSASRYVLLCLILLGSVLSSEKAFAQPSLYDPMTDCSLWTTRYVVWQFPNPDVWYDGATVNPPLCSGTTTLNLIGRPSSTANPLNFFMSYAFRDYNFVAGRKYKIRMSMMTNFVANGYLLGVSANNGLNANGNGFLNTEAIGSYSGSAFSGYQTFNFLYIPTTNNSKIAIMAQPGSLSVTGNPSSMIFDWLEITENPCEETNASISGPNEVCENASITLTASPGLAYVWTTGEKAQAKNVNMATPGTYTFGVYVLLTTTGCFQYASKTITVLPRPAALTITGSPPIDPAEGIVICSGNTITLTASSSPNGSYQWMSGIGAYPPIPNATQQSYSIDYPSGTYSTDGYMWVQTTGTNGCASAAYSNAVRIRKFPNKVNAYANTAPNFFEGGSAYLSVSQGNVPGVLNYKWYRDGAIIPGATAANYTATQGGVYIVTNEQPYTTCIPTSDPITVTVYPTPTISPANPVIVCGPTTLTASAGSSYLWSTGATTQSITASTSGNYSVTVTRAFTFYGQPLTTSATSAVTTVTFESAPAATISGGTLVGPVSNTTLTASAGASYLWSTGETTQSITASIGGYWVKVYSTHGCFNTSATVIVSPDPQYMQTITFNPVTVCTGTPDITLSATASSGLPVSYSCLDPAVTITGNVLHFNVYKTVQVTAYQFGDATHFPAYRTASIGSYYQPAAYIYVIDNNYCQNGYVQLGVAYATSYNWLVGNAYPTTSGSVSISFVDVQGCSGSTDLYVQVDNSQCGGGGGGHHPPTIYPERLANGQSDETDIDPLAGRFALYPNPVDKQLFVHLDEPVKDAARLQIIDMLGRVHLQDLMQAGEYKRTINTENMIPGTYLLQIEGGTKSRVTKVVVIH